MRIITILIFTILLLNSCSEPSTSTSKSEKKFDAIPVNYMTTKMDSSVSDDFHGTNVNDPYRWLEDDNSDETKEWVKDQNKVTFGYLDNVPFKNKIKDRLEKLWNYEKYTTPFKKGDRYYYFKNDGLQNQNVLFGVNNLADDPTVVLDPNKFSDDGTSALGSFSFSKDGRYLAYQISEGGSDWRTVYVKDMTTNKQLKDKVEWIKFSGISWSGDGFFYSRYPLPEGEDYLSAKNENHQVFYHKLGTDQASDKLIFQDKEHPQRNAYCGTTEDEQYLILNTVESTSGNGLFVSKTTDPSNFTSLVKTFDYDFTVIHNEGNNLYVLTNENAPNQKLIKIDLNNSAPSNWKDVIAESKDALRGINVIDQHFYASYIHNASSKIKIFDLTGKHIDDLDLPGIGTVGGVNGDKDDSEMFYSFTSYTVPTTIYRYDAKTTKSEVFKAPNVDFDASQFETKQVWYTSYDGTKVPMFITHKKGLKLDGSSPTLLYGYGGFNIPILPRFELTRIPILENGGVYAVANIRGGGEFGKAWHDAGTKGEKQNVFDDFQAAAEYLIKENYTSSDKLAIEGRSNGGLLVGACMTQRPDLYKVAFPAVGVLDMLRYHKFTIGWAWATDYGRSDDKEAFDYLIKYSPLHNIKEVEYPATMVSTADHDDRVVPAHSFKFISELQKNQKGDNPVLIRVETSAGHGAGKSTEKRIEEASDMLSFMFYNMNIDPYLAL